MAKWTCKCGHSMNDHKCPDENYYRVYSDSVWDTIPCDEKGNLNFTEDIPNPTFDVYMCPKCNRLMVYGNNYKIMIYKREE